MKTQINKPYNAWKLLYRLMDNVKTLMDKTIEDKKYTSTDEVTNEDVNKITKYINDSINKII